MRLCALACGMMVAACLTAQQQERCTVEGRVVKSNTGEPLRKARVVLRKTDARDATYSASTGEDGRFVIPDVQPGRFRLGAERNGYLSANYGQRRPNEAGTVLTLAPGEHRRDIVFNMIPFAVISGRVGDEDGDALVHVRVQAMRSSVENGRREFMPAGSASTDDRGEYRIFGLPPGRYYVSAIPLQGPGSAIGQAEEESYVPFFYPGVTDVGQAAPLEVRAGGDLHGVDFRLARMRTVRVRGRVVSAPTGPRPDRGIVVFLLQRGGLARDVRMRSSVVDSQGNFEIRGVPPGSYVLTVFQSDRQRRFFARQAVDVGNSTIEGVNLVLMPGIEIAGRVRFEDGAGSLEAVRLLLESRNGNFTGGSVAPVKPDGSFVLQNVAADEYRFSVLGLTEECYLKAARLGGTDVLAGGLNLTQGEVPGGLDILLSTAGGHVEGTVMNDSQQPAAGATVALVPDGERRSRPELFRWAYADDAGRFVLRGIPPGDYRLFAWENVEPGAWLDPDFLRDYQSRGEALSVSERGRYNPRLKSIPASNSGN